jgi:hypothetical protein
MEEDGIQLPESLTSLTKNTTAKHPDFKVYQLDKIERQSYITSRVKQATSTTLTSLTIKPDVGFLTSNSVTVK